MRLPRAPTTAMRAWPFPRVRERVVRGDKALEVVDVLDRRELRAHGDSTQGALYFDDPGRPALAYLKSLLAAVAVRPLKRVLCLGLGPGALPWALRGLDASIEVDAVEVDPVVVELARRWFGFDALPRATVHLGDARDFLQASGGTWDAIFCDAYDGPEMPRHLGGEAFLRLLRARSAPGGVVATNVWPNASDPRGTGFVVRHRAVFDDVVRLPCEGAPNVIVVARAEAALPSKETWLARLSAWPALPSEAWDAVRGLDRDP